MLDVCRSKHWLRHTQTKNDGEKRINTKTVTLLPKSNTNTNRSLDYARMSIIVFNKFWKLIETYIYVRKKHHLQVTPQQSTQNTTNLPLQTYEKTKKFFLFYDTGVDFSSRNNFANLDSFAKGSIPVRSIMPRSYLQKLEVVSTHIDNSQNWHIVNNKEL